MIGLFTDRTPNEVSMASRRSGPMPRKRKARTKPCNSAIPDGLRGAIEAERGKLVKAESLLGCLAISLEYGCDSLVRPYYPDVAQVACDLVRQSIDGLDSLTLERLMGRSSVKEGSTLLMGIASRFPATSADSRTLICDSPYLRSAAISWTESRPW